MWPRVLVLPGSGRSRWLIAIVFIAIANFISERKGLSNSTFDLCCPLSPANHSTEQPRGGNSSLFLDITIFPGITSRSSNADPATFPSQLAVGASESSDRRNSQWLRGWQLNPKRYNNPGESWNTFKDDKSGINLRKRGRDKLFCLFCPTFNTSWTFC